MIVGDHDPDHRTGTSSRTLVPAPSRESTMRLPPACRASSSTSDRPRCPSVRRRSRTSGAKPRPSSATSRRAIESGDVDLDRDGGRVGIRDHVADRLLRNAIDERLRVRIKAVVAVDPELDLRPACREWADEVADRRVEARGGENRWVEVDEQGTQVAHGAAEAIDHLPNDRGVRVCSS